MESAELKKLIRRRGGIKSRVTCLKSWLDRLESGSKPIKYGLVKLRLDASLNLIDEFLEIQDQLISEYEDETKLEETYAETETFSAEFYNTISAVNDLLEKITPSTSTTVEPVHSLNTAIPQNNVKLPTIDLPHFNGAPDAWLDFRGTFESLIHNNNLITPVNKLHYLRAVLRDEAADVIKSLQLSDQNYIIAWNILCERYNNTRMLSFNHIKALFNLESVGRESAPKLRKLIDGVKKHIRALNSIRDSESLYEAILIYIVSEKLDKISTREWEQSNKKDSPKLDDLLDFIRDRANLLEKIEHVTIKQEVKKHTESSKSFASINNNCVSCNQSHYINKCPDFLKLTIEQRYDFSKSQRLCLNCLRKGHMSQSCQSAGTCRKCGKKHNTLLHRDANQTSRASQNSDVNTDSVTLSANDANSSSVVLLSTAVVYVVGKSGETIKARALLDCGSQSSFITAELCDNLKLTKTKTNISISGIGQSAAAINHRCRTDIEANHGSYKANISFLILPRIITGKLPRSKIDTSFFKIPHNIKLADPFFNMPGTIDLLIGADYFWDLICNDNAVLQKDGPVLQKTMLGWVVSGKTFNQTQSVYCNISRNLDINSQLERFWTVESCESETKRSQEEIQCEDHYIKNMSRAPDGKFVISIPLKRGAEILGESEAQARRRFAVLERKLQKDSALRLEYVKFMREYEMLGHMTKLNDPSQINSVNFYLPHHAVIKESSSTTKLRVVFDGSAKASSGYSLNDIQLVGPTIQNDLLSILLRFRKYTYVMSADIEKMYRQILMEPKHRSLQQIFWRESPHEPLSQFQLNTVTYGTASASYLAIRSLYQLSIDFANEYPLASNVIRDDFYVDDLLTGSDSLEGLLKIKNDLTIILNTARFSLRKWSSNNERILSDHVNSEKVNFCDGAQKTLGVSWNPNTDALSFSISLYSNTSPISKRELLSHIAQIFDPLGLLAPAIIIAKIMLQKLWTHKLSWDDPLPHKLEKEWVQFRKSLYLLNSLEIPRQTTSLNYTRIELHGFSDASNAAYGACIFLRSEDGSGNVNVNLLCAKTRVAPLKSLTIPRLELCGALLLAQLSIKAIASLKMKFNRCTLWSDSTIVLAWIKTPPNLLKVFVQNRVAEIQEATGNFEWRHVPTNENPADFLSRGVNPTILSELKTWWHGPTFLQHSKSEWPEVIQTAKEVPELRTVLNTSVQNNQFPFNRYSDIERLERAIAYCMRFKTNALAQINNSNRYFGPLLIKEIINARDILIRMSQFESFFPEINALSDGKLISKKSRILNLNPYLDETGMLRVGGRLQNSRFDLQKRHPKILSSHHPLTKLIFSREHKRLMHAGPQSLLASIRQTYWPIAGRNLAKRTVRECTRCHRFTAIPFTPVMGNLPEMRVTQQPPFHTTGVDYAGPFLIKDRRCRGYKLVKGYISLFICFATKAIHMELVSELTKAAFISCFRRFASRRGLPLNVYSDNAKNFVGADAELASFFKHNEQDFINKFNSEGVHWHFIPPRSPHFGGLWEAGVKSAKSHLKRVLGNANLSYEDFYTTIVKIEAILNSRPITPLSNDPNDLLPLTPAHFLIGRTITSLPEPDYRDVQINRMSRFQRAQQIQQHFWTRWSQEYISELQQRSKWKQHQNNIKIDTVVLIKEENLPPLKWQLGRVVELHPGKDRVVRVVSLRTQKGIIRRTVQKLCPLPLFENVA